MLLQTTPRKVILAIIAVLLLVTTGKDWYDFAQCGAVDHCIASALGLQLYTKSAISLLVTVLAFIVSAEAFSPRDRRFLRIAFVCSLLGDFSFSLFRALTPPEYVTTSDVLGILFFMAFLAVLIHRHSRTSETDLYCHNVYWRLLGTITAVAIILYALGAFSIMVAMVLAYAFYIVTSTVVGANAPFKGYYPAKNALFVRWGMITFFVGDVLVGLSMISGADHSAMETISAIANNFIWWFYVPAQLMLIKSCTRLEN